MKWGRNIFIAAFAVFTLLAATPVSAREPITEEALARANIQLDTQLLGYYPVHTAAHDHTLRGIDDAEQGDFGGAMDNLDTALELDPGLAEAYTVRARVHQGQRNHQYAVNDLTLATQIPPPSSDAYRLRGASHASLGNYAAALADYNKAIELDPANADAYYNRAVLYQFGLGQPSNALADYSRVIELVPSALSALNNRAIILALRGEHRAALADMAAYARHNNNVLPPHVLDTRAYIYLRQGNYQAAIADYKSAMDAGFDSVYVNLGLGIAVAKSGNTAQAASLLQEGLAYIHAIGANDLTAQLDDLYRRALVIVNASAD